jgi:hypothetical protein
MSIEPWAHGPERERPVRDPDEGGDAAVDAAPVPIPDPKVLRIIAAHARNEHVAEPFRSLLNGLADIPSIVERATVKREPCAYCAGRGYVVTEKTP